MVQRMVTITALFVGLFIVSPTPAVQAAAQPVAPLSQVAACTAGVESFLLLKTWDACLTRDDKGVPQLDSLSDIWVILLVLLEDAIKAAGYTAVGFVTWGGIKYLKSQGDPGQITEARQIIYNALFGLLLALISVAIVNFISGAIG